MKLLVTGGAGFIGSNFVHHTLARHPEWKVVVLDKLTYAGNLKNLEPALQQGRCEFVQMDICDRAVGETLRGCDAVIHFAAESHVDRSIEDASPFLTTNIFGTQCLLEAARRFRLPSFIHISTDEVYGSAPAGESFTEETHLDPRSPYAASKAAADHFVSAYAITYGVSAVVLRCTNNYGPYQFPEKLIPLMIANAREDRPLPIYGDGLQERDWLFVEDYCSAIVLAVEKAKPGAIYNVSAGMPQSNLNVVRTILRYLGKSESLITFVQDRPGHDRRYAIDSSKIQRELGWSPRVSFEEGIRRTIEWYQANVSWLDHARSGEYQTYYERHYIHRGETFKG